MKTISYCLVLFSFLVGSCTPEKVDDGMVDIPELLPRSEAIRYGKEWDDVQNAYARYAHALRSGEKPGANAFQLAALFSSEARVTGEHGHYYPAALDMVAYGLQTNGLSDDERFLGLTTQASVLMSQHEFKQALDVALEAEKLNDRNAMIYGVLVDAHVELGDYTSALAAADKMISIRPDIRSYSRISYLREINGRLESAIEAMHLAVEAGAPGSEEKAWAQLQLADLVERQGDPATAELITRDILVERPDYPFAMANIGRLMIERGAAAEGVGMLEKACRIIPEVGFYVELAKYYKQEGDSVKAEPLKREILAMLQDDIDSGHRMNMEMAEVYAELFDDYPTALKWLEAEYRLRPDNKDVNTALSGIYARIGDRERSNFHWSKTGNTGSEHPELVALRQM